MKIEVLGPGCPRCDQLEVTARAAADKLGIDYELEHIRDINQFVQRGVMVTPALAIDGVVKMSGKVPGEAELLTLLKSALAERA